MKRILLCGALMLVSKPLWSQQDVNNPAIPQISIAARGEVKVVPDRANIQISVQTRGETASAAATENNRKQSAVIDALKALGISNKDITTSGYTVYPEQRYEPNKEPVVVGYNVTNTLSVELKSIAMVGSAIDAALAKGANMINSLQFYSSKAESARQEAIGIAVRTARSDADVAAKAAGGAITGLLEINVGAYYPPPPRPLELKARGAMTAADTGTPIAPGDLTIAVDVGTRWQFKSM